jgi:putative transposase
VDEIRKATNGNFALGDQRFAALIESALSKRVTPGQSGRPRKLAEPESGALFG